MNWWLLCLPREDLERCMDVGVFGLARKGVIQKIKSGDGVVLCAGKGDWKIIAAGKSTSDYYLDDSKIFLKEGVFPDRFNFNAKKLDPERDLMEIIDKLSFVTNLAYWAVFFRTALVKMSKADAKLLLSSKDYEALDS
jgi:hypothetical protein